jgi:mono/diheme cytochrome c family protein
MLKVLLLLSAVTLFEVSPASTVVGVTQEAAPVPPAIPATPPDTKNPIKPTPELQAKAKKVYGYECEMCHGATGDGKTDLAKDMKMTLSDLTDPKTLADKTDAQLFDLIKNGKGQMTPEGDRMKPDDIWNLVTYIRGMSKGH